MRKKNSSIFLSVFLAIFWEKYVSGLSKKLPFKCLKPIFSWTPYQGVALDPMGALGGPHTLGPFCFWLDGPMAHQVHFPGTSLIANDNTDFFQFIEIFPNFIQNNAIFPNFKGPLRNDVCITMLNQG